MSLTDREKQILHLKAKEGLSDYKIARRIGIDPPSITCSRQNALKKLTKAKEDLAWAQTIGITV